MSVSDVSRIALPRRGAEGGALLMLKCFLDDSGTHADSSVVVWGGVIGLPEEISKLDAAWRARLQDPGINRRPIKSFSSFDCARGMKEFEGYNQAERDHTRYLFRQVLAEAGLSYYACAIPTADWDDVMQGEAREFFGSASFHALNACLSFSLSAGFSYRQKEIAVVLDKGAMVPGLVQHMDKAAILVPSSSKIVETSFLSVNDFPALQAADMVATEYYWGMKEFMKTGEVKPDAHFRSLIQSGRSSKFDWFLREHLADLSARFSNRNRPFVAPFLRPLI